MKRKLKLHKKLPKVGNELNLNLTQSQSQCLYRLGWTQEEIAENIGTTKQNYQQGICQEFPELEKLVKNILDSGIPHLDVAERFNMPLILVHAIANWDLEFLKNLEAEELRNWQNFTPPIYNVWKKQTKTNRELGERFCRKFSN